MPAKSYFLTFLYFDTKHQRTNKFSHLSIALMEGEKSSSGHLFNVKLTNGMGYYSHKMPNEGKASKTATLLKKIANIQFRLKDFYAEFKQEDLITLDMGFGIKGGPIIEISIEEKAALEQRMREIQQNEAQFFAEADKEAHEKVASMSITDPRMKKSLETEMRNLYREKYYQHELATIDNYIEQNNLQQDLLLEETALASGLISPYRMQQEKLRAVKHIEFFEFTFNPQGRTCKTMGLELVLECLTKDGADRDERRKYLSELFAGQYYTRSLPLASKDAAKMIFYSNQDHYAATAGRPPLPKRTWADQDNISLLAVCDTNTYMDLNGKKHELHSVEHPKIYNDLVENLLHLQRLLNDFCSPQNHFQAYLSTLNDHMRHIIVNSYNIHHVIFSYHQLLKTLYSQGCFSEISEFIFKSDKPLNQIKNLASCLDKQHLKLEDGVKVELKRLLTMEKQAQKDSLLQELLPVQRSKFFDFFTAPKQTTTSTEPPLLAAHRRTP